MINEGFGTVDYQNFENEVLETIPFEYLQFCELSDFERRFLNGIVRYHKPKNILELGVSSSGGTVVLLNAIKCMPNTKLISVDYARYWYREPYISVGVAAKFFASRKDVDVEDKWTLHTAKIALDVLPNENIKYDLLVLDTVHIHPVETLDFLTSLPYLSENAIVVIHDISAFYYMGFQAKRSTVVRKAEDFPCLSLANRLLFDIVKADKVRPSESYIDLNDIFIPYPNIGAFQVNAGTRNAIGDVFSGLEFPWGLFPDYAIRLLPYIERHYSAENFAAYKTALRVNYILHGNNCKSYLPSENIARAFGVDINNLYIKTKSAEALLHKFDRIIFYGAGNGCRIMLDFFKHWFFLQPYKIWDRKADEIKTICGIEVEYPLGSAEGTLIIISLLDKKISKDIKQDLKTQGIKNVVTAREVFA